MGGREEGASAGGDGAALGSGCWSDEVSTDAADAARRVGGLESALTAVVPSVATADVLDPAAAVNAVVGNVTAAAVAAAAAAALATIGLRMFRRARGLNGLVITSSMPACTHTCLSSSSDEAVTAMMGRRGGEEEEVEGEASKEGRWAREVEGVGGAEAGAAGEEGSGAECSRARGAGGGGEAADVTVGGTTDLRASEAE